MGKVLCLPEGKLLLLTHLAYGCSKGDAVRVLKLNYAQPPLR